MVAENPTPEERLAARGVTLPPPPPPVARYVSVTTVGNLAFVSGHGPFVDGELAYIGRLGENMDVETGQQSARCVALNILASLKQELGELDRIERAIKLLIMVNSSPHFLEQPVVANGATELFVKALGEQHGISARSAVGMASLPFGISVEIEGVFEIRP